MLNYHEDMRWPPHVNLKSKCKAAYARHSMDYWQSKYLHLTNISISEK